LWGGEEPRRGGDPALTTPLEESASKGDHKRRGTGGAQLKRPQEMSSTNRGIILTEEDGRDIRGHAGTLS